MKSGNLIAQCYNDKKPICEYVMSAANGMISFHEHTELVFRILSFKRDLRRRPAAPYCQIHDPLDSKSRGYSLCLELIHATSCNNRDQMILLFDPARAVHILQNPVYQQHPNSSTRDGFQFLQELVPIFENNIGGVQELLDNFLTPQGDYGDWVAPDELQHVLTTVQAVHQSYQQHKDIEAAVNVQLSRASLRNPHKM